MYDEFGGNPEAILDQIYQLEGDAKVPYEFLKKIHDLRLFFGDFFQSQYETLKTRLEINFTVNKKDEANTDYLVDRVFRPNNDAAIEPITPDKSAIWYFGTPIEMELRWAVGDDQAPKPVYSQNDPDLIIENSTARIQCVGIWSLIRFLRKYKATVVSSNLLSPNQWVLELKIPLSNGKIARVFVGITVSIPKKPGDSNVTNVKVPKAPGKMPDMPSFVISVANEPVLIYKASSNLFETPILDEVSTQEDEAEPEPPDNEPTKPARKKRRPRKAQRKARTQHSSRKPNNEDVLDVLKSDEKAEIGDGEPIIEVNETPIM
jgi:hypothetical protein